MLRSRTAATAGGVPQFAIPVDRRLACLYLARKKQLAQPPEVDALTIGRKRIVPRQVVYESVIPGSVGLAQLTTAESRVG